MKTLASEKFGSEASNIFQQRLDIAGNQLPRFDCTRNPAAKMRIGDFRMKNIFRYTPFFFVLLAFLSSASSAHSQDVIKRITEHQFDVAEPQVSPSTTKLKLWATQYFAHRLTSENDGIPLLTMDGKDLGFKLSAKNWCAAAIEGTAILVESSKLIATFNYAGVAPTSQTDCSRFVPVARRHESWVSALGRTRFLKTDAPYGLGTSNNILVPFRTIAVDPRTIPIGSVIYIPQARGVRIILFDGRTVTHDGYFYAGDVGGAIKLNHIDVFTGLNEVNPFSFILSREQPTFEAVVVTDSGIIERMRRLHRYH